MKIARCTPSRGLVHSRVEAYAEEAREYAVGHGHEWRNFWTHDLPIPDCFNRPCELAYEWGADVIWILEEDVAPVELGTFVKMLFRLHQGDDYVTTTYPVEHKQKPGYGNPLTYDALGRLAWCATGCFMLKRACFDLIPQPWFTLTGRIIKNKRVAWESRGGSPYGCDIAFTTMLHLMGLRGSCVFDPIDHYRVRQMGDKDKNAGYHIIEPLDWGVGGTNQWQFSQEQAARSKLALQPIPPSER